MVSLYGLEGLGFRVGFPKIRGLKGYIRVL